MTPIEYAFYVFVVCSAIFIVPGQIFFLSINEGMQGFRQGLIMLLGVLTAQSILLVLLDIGFIIILQRILSILKIIGAVLLIILGASALRGAIRGSIKNVTSTTHKRIGPSYARGFLLTFLNPPFILWFVTIGATLLETGIKELGSFAYVIFALILLASSATVILAIILTVHGGKRLIGMREIRVLSFISGTGFVIIAITIIASILNA